MKNKILYIFSLLLLLGCQSWDAKDPVINPATTVEELQVDADFDWRTSENIVFYIKNAPIGIIEITSVDGNTLFHKGNYTGVTASYQIIVNVPTYLTAVKINENIVDINDNVITYEFPDTAISASFYKSLESSSSLLFDGESSYVDVDRKMIEDFPFTMSAWVKTSGFAKKDEDMVILSYANPEKSDEYFGIFIGEDESGVACLRARKKSEKTIAGSTVITDGKWHQVVAVFEGEKDRRLYVDGQLEASDGNKMKYSDKMDLLTIGRWGDKTPMSYFNGYIDEVQIWEKALSTKEVETFYNAVPEGNESKLVAYYNMDSGSGSKLIDVVSGDEEGDFHEVSWSEVNIGDSGGAGESDDNDGDGILNGDDDFPDDANYAFLNKYPASGFGTLAFEDLWPGIGDYDFNDLVIDYQFQLLTNSENLVSQIKAEFIVRAIGASYKNGFGFQLSNDNISVGDLNVSGYLVDAPFISLGSNGLENEQLNPTFIVFDNAFDILPRTGGELGVNTDPDASVSEPKSVNIVINVTPNKYTLNQINISNFNPFIFVNEDRSKEIHMANNPPTTLANPAYFNTSHDDSNASTGRYYKTVDNLPWGINIYETFDYPSEKNAIIKAYLKFASWAETNGVSFSDWYQNKIGYREDSLIYSPN